MPVPSLLDFAAAVEMLTAGIAQPTFTIPSDAALVLSHKRWQRARHLDLLETYVLGLLEGSIASPLIVSMPPRHGKSEFCSHWLPVWFLDQGPDREIILASYESDFATSWGRKVRRSLEEGGVRARLRRDSTAANRWETTEGGGMVAVGVGGATMGRGAHLFVIDDPVKNAEEASSLIYRERAWEWYQSVATTRLEPGGKVILVMSRWNEDDLAGRIIGSGQPYTLLRLPAIAEEGDLLGREIDEALWPERYNKDALMDIKATIGSYFWNALYLGQPSSKEGGILKRNWWRYWEVLPGQDTEHPRGQFDSVIQSWDMTFKDAKDSDFVVGQVWGKKGADRYLLDQVRDRMDVVATIQALKSLSAKWPEARGKIVEDTANGPAIISLLKHEVEGLIAWTSKGSKESRVQSIQPLLEAGNVYIPSSAPWVSDFIEECSVFPNGAHDDQVDAMSQALLRLGRMPELTVHHNPFYGTIEEDEF